MSVFDYFDEYDWILYQENERNPNLLLEISEAHRAERETMPDVPYENLKCPKCDGAMVSRKGKYGIFWGCKAYPHCDGTRDSLGRSKEERDAERSKIPEYESEWNERKKEDSPSNFTFNKRK